ncbi:MAG: cation transporter [Saprospiraceae bacterium]|nr:cation transporter [Saprospiraceae bacterium]
MTNVQENYSLQKKVVLTGIILFIIKITAWYLTDSVAILTDALESTVNVVSGFIGLYSLYLSGLPKDKNHPYGHGKVEFISAGTEGVLIVIAGVVIIFEAVSNLRNPHLPGKLDIGIVLISVAGIINYIVGFISVRQGKKNNSLALVASGRHLQSDAYSTLGLIIGLIILYLTGWAWVDSLLALLFAGIIIYTGIKIVGSSISGIMDEADDKLLEKLVENIQTNRRTNWIDLHNLRIIKYGGTLHMDCHLTVPWYFNVREAHEEVELLDKLVKENFGDSVELFVHTDGCLDFSCKLCDKKDCNVRQYTFEKIIPWTVDNISVNQKHSLDGPES